MDNYSYDGPADPRDEGSEPTQANSSWSQDTQQTPPRPDEGTYGYGTGYGAQGASSQGGYSQGSYGSYGTYDQAQSQPSTGTVYGQAQPTASYPRADQTQAQPEPEPEKPRHAPKGKDKPKKKDGRGVSAVKAVVLGVVGGIVGAAALVGVLLLTGVISTGGTTSTSTASTTTITIDTSDEDTSVATAVAAKVLSSVCSVYCTYSDSSSGMGSGVIYDTDGNIITNYHVIEDASYITVTIDGNSYDAEVVGYDSSSDIAVIKAELNGDSVTPIEVGDSDELQVGDWVMTVGSPFGLEQSVSSGIVSALYRNTLLESTSGNTLYTNLIQVDAAINPGNSGGALVNSAGQLVGICTLYSSDTESFAGIGFAIPGNYAVELADTIIAGETVLHPYIGLTMTTVSSLVASQYGLSVSQGAYVVEVTEGSPADEAGIEAGDVIIAIGDDEITSADGAILAVRSHDIGETVTVTVMRGSEELSFEVTLGTDEALQSTDDDDSDSDSDSSGDSTSDELLELFQEWLEQQDSDGTDSDSDGTGFPDSTDGTDGMSFPDSTDGYGPDSNSTGAPF